PQEPGADPGWVPVSGGCLGFFPWELSWSRAEAFCRRFGSSTHLASVHSEEELQAVADLLFSRSGDASEEELDEEVWIGLHRPLRSRSWQWSDGTAVAYNSWHRASFTRRRACAALQDATGEPGTGAPTPAAPAPVALAEPRGLVAMAGAAHGWLVRAHTHTDTRAHSCCAHTRPHLAPAALGCAGSCRTWPCACRGAVPAAGGVGCAGGSRRLSLPDFTTWEAEACSDRKPFICKSLS
uniref:C-type lectin domain-containing protein n=1 Tax=Anas platyrhynchos TaxID=8839 RepID=A0A8B9T7Z1_ANAPL